MNVTSRPVAVKLLVGVLGFLGACALGGGGEMLAYPRGGPYLPPERLERIPRLRTYVLPGLVLGSVFGLGSLATAVGMSRRVRVPALDWVERWTGRHWSWAAALDLGWSFAAWLGLEVALLGGPPAVDDPVERRTAWATYGVFGSVAAALVGLPWVPGVRRWLQVGHDDVDGRGNMPVGTGSLDQGPCR